MPPVRVLRGERAVIFKHKGSFRVKSGSKYRYRRMSGEINWSISVVSLGKGTWCGEKPWAQIGDRIEMYETSASAGAFGSTSGFNMDMLKKVMVDRIRMWLSKGGF